MLKPKDIEAPLRTCHVRHGPCPCVRQEDTNMRLTTLIEMVQALTVVVASILVAVSAGLL
ncbi:MAG: hypothetical protein AMXMBFR64_42210 [Myxococcales bacterium]